MFWILAAKVQREDIPLLKSIIISTEDHFYRQIAFLIKQKGDTIKEISLSLHKQVQKVNRE